MGRIFLAHPGGSRLFSCANCDTALTNRSQLTSTVSFNFCLKNNVYTKQMWTMFCLYRWIFTVPTIVKTQEVSSWFQFYLPNPIME